MRVVVEFVCWLLYCSVSLIRASPHAPKTVLVSLDGFRWDYLFKHADVLPNFHKVAREGVHVEKGLLNAYVTKTFPNHRTMVTGLWHESHGIIDNDFWAPDLNDSFNSSRTEIAFWNSSKPIWTVAEEFNITSVCVQFPGCFVKEQQATYTVGQQYDDTMTFHSLVDNLTHYFHHVDNPAHFGVMYWHQPDRTGHLFGPESEQMRGTLATLDSYLEYLVNSLGPDVNIVVTSDHGMTEVPANQIISISDYLNPEDYDHLYDIALTHLLIYSKPHRKHLLLRSLQTFQERYSEFKVMTKDQLPDRWHFKRNIRVPDVMVVAACGWLIAHNSTIAKLDSELNGIIGDQIGRVMGEHGFDTTTGQMHPVFLAKGPGLRTGYVLPAGQMRIVDVYPLIARLIGLPQQPTNGSLSTVLPLLNLHVHNEF